MPLSLAEFEAPRGPPARRAGMERGAGGIMLTEMDMEAKNDRR